MNERDSPVLSDTVAIVTGASRGIGREITTKFAEAGASVTAASRSDGIYETVDQIDNGGQAIAVETDVTDEDSVHKAIKETISTFGSIDCVVNNAGIAGPTRPIEHVELDQWEQTLSVNVTGMFLMIKYAAPFLRKSERGSVINISSISGKRPLEHRTPYTTSKMAVIGLTRTAAAELGTDDVTVNAICPGATQGPRIEAVIEKQADQMDVDYEEAKRNVFTEDALLEKFVEPDDISSMAVYLASEAGQHITAQDINIDAGTAWY